MGNEVVTLADCRALRYCSSGIKAWMERHGLKFERLRDGVPIAEIEAIDDEMARRVIRYVRAGRVKE